jgi:hypothetical protein
VFDYLIGYRVVALGKLIDVTRYLGDISNCLAKGASNFVIVVLAVVG